MTKPLTEGDQVPNVYGVTGNVKMVAPDGRELSVPASDVARLEALGAKRR
jgi:hypothetical protein